MGGGGRVERDDLIFEPFFLGLHFAGNHNKIIFRFLRRLQEETFSFLCF